MNPNKAVLQNAKEQLEANRVRIYNDAYSAKYAELKEVVDKYAEEKAAECTEALNVLKQAYDDAVAEKKAAYEEAVAAKRQTIDTEAKIYANQQANVSQGLIDKIQGLIENVGE